MKLTFTGASLLLLVLSCFYADGKDIIKAHPGKKVVCYFGSWSVYRPSPGKFDVESIDPFLCTHAIYSFAGLRNGVITLLDPYNDLCEDWGQGALERFSRLKLVNPALKTMIAIGGWNEGSKRYSEMVQTKDGRSKFISSVLSLMEKFNLDGFDLDWEYPANRGGVPEDKEKFVSLIQELRSAFDEHGYLLSAAVSAGEPTIKSAYDVPRVSMYLDFINVMAYDFHGAWDKVSGHHSPMYQHPLDEEKFSTFNVNHSIQYWISEGAHPEKLVLGMGTYGRGVILDNEEEYGLYSPGSQPLPPGPFTREQGYWGYNEICELIKHDNWTVVRDTVYTIAPYAHKARLWVGYDDIESIKYKSSFILSNGLGGGMVWSLETDDFQGSCHGERFPIIKTIYRSIIGDYGNYEWQPMPPRSTTKETCRPEMTTPVTVTSTSTTASSNDEEVTKPSVSETSNDNEICTESGLVADPMDCTMFFNCVQNDRGSFKAYHLKCGPGTAFDRHNSSCTHVEYVEECHATSVSHIRQGHT